MADKRDFSSAMVSDRKEVVLTYKNEAIRFFAEAIGFLASQNIAVKAASEGKNGLALLVAESVVDEDGNKFTYEEACKLKKEFADPLFAAVIEVNGIGASEKN